MYVYVNVYVCAIGKEWKIVTFSFALSIDNSSIKCIIPIMCVCHSRSTLCELLNECSNILHVQLANDLRHCVVAVQ